MIKLDEEDYSLYMNRLYLFDEIRNLHLKKIGSGTEADIYKFNKEYLLKIYKDQLLEEKSEIYNDDRLEQIASLRNKLKNTNLVFGPVYINQEFSGALTYNHRCAPNLNILDLIPSTKYKLRIFQELLENLREFENNNLYHIDITEKNVLLPFFKSPKIIDTDANSIRFEEDRNSYYEYRMYGGLFDLMLRRLFHYDMQGDVPDNYLQEAFKGYNIDPVFMHELSNEKYNYELMRDFLTYLKNSKILSYKRETK